MDDGVDLEDVSDGLAGDDIGARAVGGEPAVVQHDQPIGKSDCEVEVVQDRDDGGASRRATGGTAVIAIILQREKSFGQ